MIDALEQSATPAPVAVRIAAIVQTSVFDAINGVTHVYRPYYVTASAPRHSSARAAAVGAAYEALAVLIPAQLPKFDALKTATSDDLGQHPSAEKARGLAWGVSVADAILAWRANDGFTALLPPCVAKPDDGSSRYSLQAAQLAPPRRTWPRGSGRGRRPQVPLTSRADARHL